MASGASGSGVDAVACFVDECGGECVVAAGACDAGVVPRPVAVGSGCDKGGADGGACCVFEDELNSVAVGGEAAEGAAVAE